MANESDTSNSQQKGAERKLMRWDDDLDTQLLLAIDSVIREERQKFNWSKVASLLPPPCTAGACEQHIAKLRKKRQDRGLPTPALPQISVAQRGRTFGQYSQNSSQTSEGPIKRPKLTQTRSSRKYTFSKASSEASDDSEPKGPQKNDQGSNMESRRGLGAEDETFESKRSPSSQSQPRNISHQMQAHSIPPKTGMNGEYAYMGSLAATIGFVEFYELIISYTQTDREHDTFWSAIRNDPACKINKLSAYMSIVDPDLDQFNTFTTVMQEVDQRIRSDHRIVAIAIGFGVILVLNERGDLVDRMQYRFGGGYQLSDAAVRWVNSGYMAVIPVGSLASLMPLLLSHKSQAENVKEKNGRKGATSQNIAKGSSIASAISLDTDVES